MAGMILFVTLGLTFAVGLALIDDRLYRRADIDQLGIAVLGVIPAAQITARARPTAKAKSKATAKQQRAPTFKQGDRP
jgi:hypothetical protein